MLYLCRVKPLRHYLRGFLIAAWAGDKIAEFSFPEISFHFSLRPWFFFVSPAYAGKSPAAAYACPGTQDYPRVCGKKPDSRNTLQLSPGSPPRMRGKAKEEPYRPCHPGITPACAGKRSRRTGRRWSSRDHPRVCGEKISGTTLITTQQGSPPRMRGKAPSLRERLHWHRITPAYAGKSGISPGFLLSYRDHPRVCGEKESVNDGTAIRAGSPPRMRGKARSCQANTSVTRITPAYAGKSRRVREPDTQTAGSPPRMRGKD